MTIKRSGAISYLILALLVGCKTTPRTADNVRHGDEFVACGQLIHTGTKIVLWNDVGGFNGYQSPPGVEFNARGSGISDLSALQQTVDQFVIHYDGCGSSQLCFSVLHERHLSIHFMLDTDGTIYQTIDLKERAWHATTSNTRSIGIEIANVGAYPASERSTLERLRSQHGVRTQLLSGMSQGRMLQQYDYTPQQYVALTKLTAAISKAFPRIALDYPTEPRKLSDQSLQNYHGVLGHYHIQLNKEDPGPAFDWRRVIQGARMLR